MSTPLTDVDRHRVWAAGLEAGNRAVDSRRVAPDRWPGLVESALTAAGDVLDTAAPTRDAVLAAAVQLWPCAKVGAGELTGDQRAQVRDRLDAVLRQAGLGAARIFEASATARVDAQTSLRRLTDPTAVRDATSRPPASPVLSTDAARRGAAARRGPVPSGASR